MIEKTIYIAFDGKQFDEYEDYADYEIKTQMDTIKNECKIFDKDGNTITDYQEAYYIVITTQKAADILEKLYGKKWGMPWEDDDCGYGPRPGKWYFAQGEWHSFDSFEEEY